ncbi:MAG: type II toxin-antitoxin system RelE/ParE family toxin [Verrucomicrobiae bacterium]|nr:type II toxin-antitoxin system RelE/ParE family toxin [Verrucomicrobiae bacterium]
MFQIIFSDMSAAEMARLPKPLQLEIMSEFQVMPEDLDFGEGGEKFGALRRGSETFYRFRTRDYRIYFQKTDGGVVVRRVLHRNTLQDFLFRANLPVGEDEALQDSAAFWKLIDEGAGSRRKD